MPVILCRIELSSPLTKPGPIPGLTPEQQQTLYREDLALYEAKGFYYALEAGGETVRVAFLDGPEHASHAVVIPTGLALELARMVLRAVATPHKPYA